MQRTIGPGRNAELAECAGVLLQELAALGSSAHPKRQVSLSEARAQALHAALEPWELGIDAASATILADALGTGAFSLNESVVAMAAPGSSGIKFTCGCKSGSGSCQLRIVDNTVRCNNKGCSNCGSTLGLSVGASTLAPINADPETLGEQFIASLSSKWNVYVSWLRRVRLPIYDRVELLQQAPFGAPATALRRMPLPAVTLTGAFEAALSTSPGRLLEWAVGFYDRATISLLVGAIAGGSLEIDTNTGTLSVAAAQSTNGVTGELSCDCYGDGGCVAAIEDDTQTIFCTGSCEECIMDVTIPTSSLRFAYELAS